MTATLLNSQGQPVGVALAYAANPAEGIAIQGAKYHGNLPIAPLSPGQYTLQVQFDSPTVLGTLTLPVTIQ